MPAHSLLSSPGIASLQTGQDLAMLGQRLVLAAGGEDEAELVPDEWRPQHPEELSDELIARRLDDPLVKAADVWGVAGEVVGGGLCFFLRHNVSQLRKLCRGHLLGGGRGGKPLE